MGPKSFDGIGADFNWIEAKSIFKFKCLKSAPNLFFPSFFIFEDYPNHWTKRMISNQLAT